MKKHKYKADFKLADEKGNQVPIPSWIDDTSLAQSLLKHLPSGAEIADIDVENGVVTYDLDVEENLGFLSTPVFLGAEMGQGKTDIIKKALGKESVKPNAELMKAIDKIGEYAEKKMIEQAGHESDAAAYAINAAIEHKKKIEHQNLISKQFLESEQSFYKGALLKSHHAAQMAETQALHDALKQYLTENQISLTPIQSAVATLLYSMAAGAGKSFLLEILYNVDKIMEPTWQLKVPDSIKHGFSFEEDEDEHKIQVGPDDESLLKTLQKIMSHKLGGQEVNLLGVDEAPIGMMTPEENFVAEMHVINNTYAKAKAETQAKATLGGIAAHHVNTIKNLVAFDPKSLEDAIEIVNGPMLCCVCNGMIHVPEESWCNFSGGNAHLSCYEKVK